MTRRYTKTDLIQDIANYNRYLAESGSNYFYRHMGRYEWQAVDLCYVTEQGERRTLGQIEIGTSRECYQTLAGDWHKYSGKMYTGTKPTRKMAKTVLALQLDFTKCYYSQSLALNESLLVWAKKTKYRKPQAANGSRCRYFYAHLQNRVKV